MEMMSLKCPHCSAVLTVDDEHLLMKCPYCGDENLIIEDKEVTLKRLGIKEKQLEMEREEAKRKEYDEDIKGAIKLIPVLFLMGLGVILLCWVGDFLM